MAFEPFARGAEQGLVRAQNISIEYAAHIDTPHVILGILQIVFEAASDFAVLLARKGITPEAIEAEFKALDWLSYPPLADPSDITFTSGAKLTIEKAFECARADCSTHVGPEYLIRGACLALERSDRRFPSSQALAREAIKALGTVVVRQPEDQSIDSPRHVSVKRQAAMQMIRNGLGALALEAMETRDFILGEQAALLKRILDSFEAVSSDLAELALNPKLPSETPPADPDSTGTAG